MQIPLYIYFTQNFCVVVTRIQKLAILRDFAEGYVLFSYDTAVGSCTVLKQTIKLRFYRIRFETP